MATTLLPTHPRSQPLDPARTVRWTYCYTTLHQSGISSWSFFTPLPPHAHLSATSAVAAATPLLIPFLMKPYSHPARSYYCRGLRIAIWLKLTDSLTQPLNQAAFNFNLIHLRSARRGLRLLLILRLKGPKLGKSNQEKEEEGLME